jgi:type IV pilus assembly protein PilM
VARLGAKADKTAGTSNTGKVKPAAKARPSGGSFVGIDIGSHSIKAVEVKGSGTGLAVTGYGQVPTPAGTIQSGIISDPKRLAVEIKALLKKIGQRTNKSVSAAAGADGVVVRVIEVAPMSATELKDMMRYEVERHIPFSASDIGMSYSAIEPDEPLDPNMPPTQMEVLLAVARNDMVASHLQTLQAAGLQPIAVDIEPLAVGRALLDLSKTELAKKNVVIVNIGSSMTDVGVYKSGVLRFPRTIPIAGDNFTRAISDHLGISMEAAEADKLQDAVILMDMIGRGAPASDDIFGGFDAPAGGSPFDIPASSSPFDIPASASQFDIPASPSGSPFDIPAGSSPFDIPATPTPATEFDPYANAGAATEQPVGTTSAASETALAAVAPEDPRERRRKELFDALMPVLGEFAVEVRRSVDYFRSRYPNELIDRIILCGGSAKISNLDKYMEYELGISSSVADPLANVSVPVKQGRPQGGAPEYAVALGLAVRDAVIGKD